MALAASGMAAHATVLPQASMDQVIAPLMKAHGITGLAVGVYANGQSHVFSYGVASKADATPVTADTLFEIGSLSKTYTATLAALAAAEGKLDLSAPASRYQTALAGAPLGKASVLELGAYSADCLPLQFPDAVQTPEQVLAFFRNWKPVSPHGTQRCYSNPSLGLFGDLAARSQQQPFATLMTGKLLPLMGLEHTYLQVPRSAQHLYAQGYDANNQPVRVNPGPFADEAYGIKTSASDLLRYTRLHMHPGEVSPVFAKTAAIAQAGYFQVGAMTQGLGWERYPLPVSLNTLLAGNGAGMVLQPQPTTALRPALPAQRDAWYNKTGSTNGFGAYAMFIPSEDVAVVLLANRNYPNEARVQAAWQILSLLQKHPAEGLSDKM
ncbi:beta-lactamase [Pseudomonas sp. PSKL.D1]|uniref:class C beta-lactamase n=1 Tax=Pseudomonas sp. PSKL.D1 TaxID=3029060 RepID=UPI002380DC2E|nr:class C beta-lactamase [Pseudomonas sp. PSKL.D1]WDY60618.1 beta-lactamase [Pseudomonas sp. PSKL.D1]